MGAKRLDLGARDVVPLELKPPHHSTPIIPTQTHQTHKHSTTTHPNQTHPPKNTKQQKALVEKARESEDNAAKCIVDCLVSCLDNLTQYLNRWAFTYIGIYGWVGVFGRLVLG